jgi:mannose-6-phosphate isomerase-like protein (cupin superfamily)
LVVNIQFAVSLRNFAQGVSSKGVVMVKMLLGVAAVSMVLAQGTAASVRVWKAGDIQAKGKALSQKLDAQKAASEVTATEGNRTFMVAHREGSGLAEWHEKQADIIMISSGEVTMVYGGTIPDAKTTAAGEMRGASITGGTQVKLGAGDVLHIPAKTPHQMILAPGTQVTYFVAKVVE